MIIVQTSYSARWINTRVVIDKLIISSQVNCING